MTALARCLLAVLVFSAIGCSSYFIETPGQTKHLSAGPIVDGWPVDGGQNTEEPEELDAGVQLGTDAGVRPSPDASIHSDPDAGLLSTPDAGVHTGVDAGTPGACSQPQSYPATIHTTLEGFVDGNGCPVQLNGMVINAYWGPGQGTFSLGTYQQIANAGFKAVRIWINWSDFEPNEGSFSSDAFGTLNTAIGYASQARIYVILCPIFVNNGEERIPNWAREGDALTDIKQHAAGYLGHIGQLFKSNHTVAAYDLVNEPGGDNLSENDILRMYATAMQNIRATDPKKVVFIEPQWGDWGWVGTDWSNLPDRTNVALSLHDYFAGGSANGYSSSGSGNGNSVWDGVSGYPYPNPGELEAHLLVQLNEAKSVGIPLQIGEFGINPYATNANTWAQQQVQLFKKYGLSYIWWDYNCQSQAQRYGGGDAFAAADENCNFMPIISNLR